MQRKKKSSDQSCSFAETSRIIGTPHESVHSFPDRASIVGPSKSFKFTTEELVMDVSYFNILFLL